MTEEKRRPWDGTPPLKCEVSGLDIVDEFVDGRLRTGAWALMHPDVHARQGVGLGVGKGRRYRRDADGLWTRVDG